MGKWSDSELQALRALWLSGHSAAEIALKLNRSRNSIVGKLSRLELLGEERYKHRTSTITLAGPQPDRK